jgi:lipopolysaccharide heptosyltransferase II
LIIDLARLGDVTLASPVIANLRNNHPKARIDFLVSRNSASTVLHNPKLDDVFAVDTPSGGLIKQVREVRKIAEIIRANSYDVAFILHRSFGSVIMARLAGIPVRVGLNTEARGSFLTHKIRLDKTRHRLDNNLALLELMGETITTRKSEYFPSDEISEIVKESENFKGSSPLVVINPNGVWETKRWRTEKFKILADKLISRYAVRIIVIGGKGDEKRGEMVSSGNPNVLDLTSKTSVDDLYRICKLSNLVITNDSGPMHIAACAEVPVIAIFGPTDPKRCGPRNGQNQIVSADVDCLKCYKKTCDDMVCMDKLDVDHILNKAELFLKQ